MFHAENRVLQLPVHDNAVGHDDDIVENRLVFGVVHGSQPVRKPCDRVRLARSCAVLNEIILRRTVMFHVGKQFADHVQLMIPRKDDIFFDLSFPAELVFFFLRLNKDKPENEVDERIFCEDILPHIGNAVFIGIDGIALPRVNALAVAHVERQEERCGTVQARGHTDLVQVHGKADEAPRLKAEQPRFRVSLGAVLGDCVRIRLPRQIAFEFNRDDGKSVDKDDEIDALFLARPHLFHDGENIFLIAQRRVLVERGGGFLIEQIELEICKFDAVFEKGKEASPLFGRLGVDCGDERFFQLVLEYLFELRHRFGLRVQQEAH